MKTVERKMKIRKGPRTGLAFSIHPNVPDNYAEFVNQHGGNEKEAWEAIEEAIVSNAAREASANIKAQDESVSNPDAVLRAQKVASGAILGASTKVKNAAKINTAKEAFAKMKRGEKLTEEELASAAALFGV